MSAKRRIIVTLLSCLVIAGVAAVYFAPWQQTDAADAGTEAQGLRRGRRPMPIPVVAVDAKLADVPVYLDGVGTARALNTVTVRAQVDGKLLNISFTEGQDVQKGYVLAKIDPTIYQAQYDQAVAKKAQDEATLANARLDLERYTRLAATNAINKQQLDTQKALVNQLEATVRFDQAAIDNVRAVLVLHRHRRADRRPHRHPADRRRQPGEGVGHHRHRRHHPAAADLGVLQPAAAGAAGAQPRARGGRAAGRGARRRRQDRARPRQGGGDRQPGRSDHRHGEDQGRVSQRQPAALARAVRQRPAADRHAAAGGGGADGRGAARSDRAVRVRGEGRQHGRHAAGDAHQAGRPRGGDRLRRARRRPRGDDRLRPPDRRHPGGGVDGAERRRRGRRADVVGGSAGPAERRQSRPRRDARQRGTGKGPDAGRVARAPTQ